MSKALSIEEEEDVREMRGLSFGELEGLVSVVLSNISLAIPGIWGHEAVGIYLLAIAQN